LRGFWSKQTRGEITQEEPATVLGVSVRTFQQWAERYEEDGAEGLKQQLRNPTGDMPAYAEAVMSEMDLAHIFAFLQALPGRRDVKDFTILND
jgi:hypothetical protein